MKEGWSYQGRFGCVMKVITFCLALLMCFAFLSQYVPPSSFVFFQWVGLGFPLLLIVNSGLLIFWITRKKYWLFFPLVALLANFFYYPRIYQLPFRNSPKQDSVVNMVVASYNVHGFRFDYGGSSLMKIVELMEQKKVQVLCLQEVPNDLDKQTLLKAFHFMPHITSTETVEGASNIVVLSTFPITSSQTISFPERPNCAVATDLAVGKRSIRIFTCHLQTTNWNQVKGHYGIEPEPKVEFDHLFDIESVVGRNYQYRALQADSLGQLIGESPNPVIVCGDFNDPPISYTYHKMKGTLNDSFVESGKGYSYTYRYLYKLFRIDYLFYSPADFKANYYESPDVEYSDHKPIITGLAWVN